MLEGRQPETQTEIQPTLQPLIGYIPLVIHLAKPVPGAAVLLAGLSETGSGGETGVGQPLPFRFRQGLVPEGLRFGTGQVIAAETFQLFEGTGIDKFVVLPGLVRRFDHSSICLPPRGPV